MQAVSLLHDSDYYRVEQLEGHVLKVTRKDKPFLTREDVETACDPVQRTLDLAVRSRNAILIDTRSVVGRNDPASEKMFAEHRIQMVEGFRAVALLVKTPTGLLHTQRLLREGKSDGRVFLDEAEALKFLRAAASAPMSSTIKPPRR